MKHWIDWYDESGQLVGSELSPGRLLLSEAGLASLPSSVPGSDPGGADALVLTWQAAESKWTFRAESGRPGAVTMGTDDRAETPLPKGQTGDLLHLMELRTGQKWFRYRRVPDHPVFHGAASGSVDLDALAGQPLIIGRRPPVRQGIPDAGAGRLDLDADAVKISRELVQISRTEAGMEVRVLKPDPATFLNDAAFTATRLVCGDRLQVHDYDFEFTGGGLRQVDRWATGNVSSRGVRVAVESRGETKEILKGVDVEIWSGEFIGILGGSGQGKSTLINALCGLHPATSGEVVIDGVLIRDQAHGSRVSIGLVPQEDIVHRELTVEDALTLSVRLRLRLRPSELTSLVDGVIERLQLQPHRRKRIAELSGGQRKRVSIATELLVKPAVLFLDEPSSGLDPAMELELMRQLAALSRTGMTVVCTTHLLENASLFRRIIYIHGGRAIFTGPGEEAEKWFGRNLREVYSLLQPDGSDAAEREEAFRRTASARDQIRRFPPPPAVAAPSSPPARVSGAAALGLLLLRQWKILASDRLNLIFLLAQALVIGALIGWVSSQPCLRLFLALIATMWFGCSNSAQQIVAELAVFRRERLAGLGLGSYILSKFSFLTVLTACQALVLFMAVTFSSALLHPSLVDRDRFAEEIRARDVTSTEAPSGEWLLYLLAKHAGMDINILESGTQPRRDVTADSDAVIPGSLDTGLPVWHVALTCLMWRGLSLLLAALSGVALGLTVSALARSNTQAVLWVPLILIPQILLGGSVVSLPEMNPAVRWLSMLMPGSSVRQIGDVSHLYGQRAPMVTNLTKIPGFLSAGRNLAPAGHFQAAAEDGREIVVWHGAGAGQEEYYKMAPHNAAWQNLAVDASAVGQRIIADTGERKPGVNLRADVLYPRHSLYRDQAPAFSAVAVLMAWLAACCAAIMGSLRRRQFQRK